MPLRVLAALVALLLIPATASASYDGSTGKVAYVDTENGLFIDDPFDDQPAQGPLATVATEDVQTKAFALPSPPAWSPDGTLLAYSAPVDDSYRAQAQRDLRDEGRRHRRAPGLAPVPAGAGHLLRAVRQRPRSRSTTPPPGRRTARSPSSAWSTRATSRRT